MPRGNRDDALPDNWNPMEEEYEDSGSDHLLYDKLYVTNIPLKLNEDGVENVFKAYGSVCKTFLNAEPHRRYAMVNFVDTGDAERALHGLHMKQPLNLNIEYAKKKEWHKQRKKESGKQRNSRAGLDKQPAHNSRWSAAADDRRRQEPPEWGSVSSGGRRSNGVGSGRQNWVANNSLSKDTAEDYGEYVSGEETYSLDDLKLTAEEEGLPNPEARVNLLLEEYVETKMELIRMQMRDKLGLSGRKTQPAGFSKGCFMTPDGRIVRQVSALPNSGPRLPRRTSDRQVNVSDLEQDDAEKVPELREHVCVCCGRRGEMQCGACGTTYCSAVCQRQDWTTRHASVCHNVANSSANLARAGTRVPFQQSRQPHKPVAASPEVPEQASNSASNDGHTRQGPKRSDNRNTHANRQQHNDEGKKPWQPRQNNYNRRGDNNTKASGGTTPKYQQHRNDNANFYSGGNSKANGADVASKMNPVPIRRPREKSVQNDNDDWDNNQQRRPKKIRWQLDSPKKTEFKPRVVEKVSSASTRMPINEKKRDVVKNNAQPATKAKKQDRLGPDGFVALHASPGTVLTLSVEADAATCDVDASYGQAVCVAIAEQFAAQFEGLCGDEFTNACEGSEVCSPKPGSYIALRDALDGAWYRARVLTENRAALVDAARISDVTLNDASTVRCLPESYLRAPEFSCAIGAGGGVNLKVGESYEYVVSNVSNGVCSGTLRSLVHAGGSDLGPVNLCRWRCKAEDELRMENAELAPLQAKAPAKPAEAKETATKAKTNPTQVKPTVLADSVDVILARPPVVNESKVLLVEYIDSSRVFVRHADKELKMEFDLLVQDVAVYGLDAAPLTEPQPVGGVVIAQFTDGNYYRAIIRKRNRLEPSKYMLEYTEYGNTEISTLDMLRVCPQELSLETRPALLSRVSLADVATDEAGKAVKFSEECSAYLGELKDKEVELVLTLKDASSKGSVGCEVLLCVERSKERVNERLRRMLMPQWEVMEAKGEDVLELPVLMWSDMKIARLPKGSCRLQVLDTGTLLAGAISACSADEDWHSIVAELSEELEKYTSSKVGSAPYLPRQNELCVAKFKDGGWYRAACVEHPGGAGAADITVLHVDSGRLESVAVGDVRKMLPETVKRRPAMAAYCAIVGYPEEPSNELIARTRELLSVTETSAKGGIVDCSGADATSEGEYSVVLPSVMATLTAEGLLK